MKTKNLVTHFRDEVTVIIKGRRVRGFVTFNWIKSDFFGYEIRFHKSPRLSDSKYVILETLHIMTTDPRWDDEVQNLIKKFDIREL